MKKLFGLNLENYRSTAGARMLSDPAVIALLPALHAGYFRWYGGTCANYANWRTGRFSASGNAQQGIVKGMPGAPLTAAQLAALTAAAGAKSLIQLNLCTEPTGAFVRDDASIVRQIADQLAMLESLPAGTVEYVELGNELYLRGDPASALYAGTPDKYVQAVEELMPQLRKAFPAARVGACSLADIYRALNPSWRQTIEAGLAGVVDAFTYHHYFPIPEAPTGNNTDALAIDALADYSHALGSTLATVPAGHTAWLTEWNYQSNSIYAPAMAASPAHAAVIASLALAHLSTPVVELTGPHACIGSATSVYAAIADGSAGPELTYYGQGVADVGWLLEPSGPPPAAP